MSKLRERLGDPARSGVYRVNHDVAVRDVLRGEQILHAVSLSGVRGKDELLKRIAGALRFPDWFGMNWDALNDSLCDLSWLDGKHFVLLFQNHDEVPKDDLALLIDILGACAKTWKDGKEPFFAVFVDPGRKLDLPDLHREK